MAQASIFLLLSVAAWFHRYWELARYLLQFHAGGKEYFATIHTTPKIVYVNLGVTSRKYDTYS